MKKAIAIFCTIVTVLIVFLVVSKRLRSGKSAQGIVAEKSGIRISGPLLRKSEFVWTNRLYLNLVVDGGVVRSSLNELVANLQLPEKSKLDALRVCVGTLNAYGLGGWREFWTMRLPIDGYKINTNALGSRLLNISVSDFAAVSNAYYTRWSTAYEKGGLFADIAFVTNSVDVIEMPLSQIPTIKFPDFTEVENRNWIRMNMINVFDYSGLFSNSADQVKCLRFFFFGRSDSKVCLYMVLFLWDENNAIWLPWRFTYAITGESPVELRVF